MIDRQTVLTAGVVALMTGVGVIFAAVSARLYKEPVEPVMCTPTTVVQEQPAPMAARVRTRAMAHYQQTATLGVLAAQHPVRRQNTALILRHIVD